MGLLVLLHLDLYSAMHVLLQNSFSRFITKVFAFNFDSLRIVGSACFFFHDMLI